MNTHYHLAHTDHCPTHLNVPVRFGVWMPISVANARHLEAFLRSFLTKMMMMVLPLRFLFYHIFRKGHKTQRYKTAFTNQETEARESEKAFPSSHIQVLSSGEAPPTTRGSGKMDITGRLISRTSMCVKPECFSRASLGMGSLLTSIQHLSEQPKESFPFYSLEAHK